MNGYSRYRPSNAVEALLLEAVAKRKAKSEAETAKTIDKVKDQIEELTLMFGAEAERKTRAYTDTITNVKAVAKEKARASTDSLPKIKPSIIVGAIFLEAVAEQKAKSEAEAAEAIARIRAEAEEKATTYTETISKLKAEAEEVIAQVKVESVETAVEQKAQSETESVKKVAEQKAQSEAEAKKAIAKVRTKAEEAIFEVKTEAKELIDKVIIGPRIKEIVYPQRLSWSQWLLKGIREDNVTAVIVFCLLLCIVLSAFAVSGYFVYTLLRTFL